MTADELVRRYCTAVFARTGSYKQAARMLGLDRTTVKEKVDRALLEELRRQRRRSRQRPAGSNSSIGLPSGSSI